MASMTLSYEWWADAETEEPATILVSRRTSTEKPPLEIQVTVDQSSV